MKPSLLFLCHRIPYPPNKGDKISSYHLLGYLNQHYRVFLGAFEGEKPEWDCLAREKSSSRLITRSPLTSPLRYFEWYKIDCMIFACHLDNSFIISDLEEVQDK